MGHPAGLACAEGGFVKGLLWQDPQRAGDGRKEPRDAAPLADPVEPRSAGRDAIHRALEAQPVLALQPMPSGG
jgi:hypothetical protein